MDGPLAARGLSRTAHRPCRSAGTGSGGARCGKVWKKLSRAPNIRNAMTTNYPPPRGRHLLTADRRFSTGGGRVSRIVRSDEHTAELKSLMRISFAVFIL